jgi:hypothetical protein
MKTLLLDPKTWGLLLDAQGNLALASDPYSLAQDAASAIRLVLGELWYDVNQGVPWFSDVLGKRPPVSLIQAKLVEAALTVPGVTSAKVFISSIEGRLVRGQVQIVTDAGLASAAGF